MKIKDRSEILDIGCGTGISMEILEEKHNTTGIDISKNMIKLAKAKNLNTIMASFNNLPFKESSFDNIISISALQWIRGKNSIYEKEKFISVIQEFRRILKTKGTGGIQFYPHKEGINYETIVELFRNSGFRCKIIEEPDKSNQKKGRKFLIIKKP